MKQLTQRRSMGITGVMLLLASLLVVIGSPALADSTIFAKALTDHECNSTEWHFVINQVDSEANAPASITVTFSGGDVLEVPLDKFTGGVAHYATTQNLDEAVTSASTTIYDGWSGQFNLSHGPCNQVTTTTEPEETTTTTEAEETTTTTEVEETTTTTEAEETTTTTEVEETTTTTEVEETTTTTEVEETTTTTEVEETTTSTTKPEETTTTTRVEETTTTTGREVTTTSEETTTSTIGVAGGGHPGCGAGCGSGDPGDAALHRGFVGGVGGNRSGSGWPRGHGPGSRQAERGPGWGS